MNDVPYFPGYLNESSFATLESEKTVLSILLNFPNSLDDCAELNCDHFSFELYKQIFAQIRKQASAGYDVVTIGKAIKDCDLAEVHSISVFNSHSNRTLKRHIELLVDAFKSRKMFEIGESLKDCAFDQSTPVQSRIDKATSSLMALDGDVFDDWQDAYSSAVKHLEIIEKRHDGKHGGIATGIEGLTEALDGGFQPGNLVVIGARPSMGKSALGLGIGLHIAKTHCVGFISMEMTREEISDRQAALLGYVPLGQIKRPARGLEYDRIIDAVERSKSLRFEVAERGGLNILQVRAMAKALKRKKGLDVLIVDYIGLMSGLDAKAPRAYQIEEISRGLKSLAKELRIVVVCLAQVNRGAAEGNKPPGLHELRDSGAIEQDADVVGFIHRPIMASPEMGAEWANYALLRIAKNRQGRCADIHLYYGGDQTRFAQWDGEPPSKPYKKGDNL